MADNIKIIGTISNTSTVSRYDADDINLIPITTLKEYFGGTDNYIEYYIYDAGSNLLNINYNYLDYKLPTTTGLKPNIVPAPNIAGNIQTDNVGIVSTLDTGSGAIYPIIEIDPVTDVQSFGYSSGEFKVRYNLFQNKISNPTEKALYVKEISQDRTEIRLASTTLTDADIETATNALINEINSTPTYYVDYLLNFGDNQQYVAVNVALNKATTGYEVLFKLYNPLPLEVQEKSTLWVVQEQASPYLFDINLDKLITLAPGPKLRGPNFDIAIANQNTISTAYNNYSGLITNLQTLQQTSYHQILNLMTTQSVDINVDYTDYTDFVFFGSAYQRLSNFYTKAKQIEDYNTLISTYTAQTSSIPSLITEINQYTSNINTLISQFDGYEYYLYFESSSYAWPKTNSTRPFSLLSTGSITVKNWYTNQTSSAQTYDYNNYDNLEYAVPTFVKDDDTNQPYLLFLNMVGHYFDNIWVYIKAITDVNLANNNLEQGISKDLVYDRLKSLGIKLYNSQAGEGVGQYLVGANTGSSVFDNNFTITGSYLNNIPRKDLVSELYKRLYHNLPLLVKTKGTVAGLEHLDTIFGITSSILNVKEFGGSTKSNLIKGYNEDKVRIVPNTIEDRATTIYTSASVLSNELSLQTFPSASKDFRDNDMHYVDISFSPQTQIDTYISGAIAVNNPTFNLDNYIGDPRQQYSASYSDLDDQRKLYFETGVAGFNPFTASLLDYNGFIRLIEFFDNSLFKMLSDFVPERASLSTGITINSPVLERNKSVYSVPTATEQTVYDAEYPAPEVSAQYGKLYDDLSGDKKPFYTGELSGSVVDVYQYFTDNNNPYLGDWDIYNAQHNITQSINRNTFAHSDWNVLLNNVSKSVESNVRKKIEYVWGTTGSITSSAELQDSYLTLRSYNTSRYEGSKTTSLLYNTYTSASLTYAGDDSFGKTSAIDHNSYKLAWLKLIPTQSLNFYDKTSLSLKYLIDSANQVTELNSYNNNICEIQNTFKSGTPTIFSITEPGQNKLDGDKSIWKGGYSFSPIIYRENGEVLNFTYDNYLYTTSLPLGFLGTDPNFLEYSFNGGQYPPNTPIQNKPGTNFYKINGVPSLTNEVIVDKVIPASNWPYNNTSKINYTSYPSGWNDGGNISNFGPSYRFSMFNINNFTTPQQTTSGKIDGFFNEPASTAFNNTTYKISRNGTYNISAGVEFYIRLQDIAAGWRIFKAALVLEKATPDGYSTDTWTDLQIATPITTNKENGTRVLFDQATNTFRIDPSASDEASITNRMTLNYTGNLVAGEYLRISFYLIDIANMATKSNAGTMRWRNMYWGVNDPTNTSIKYIYTDSYTSTTPFFTLSTTYKTNDTLIFNTVSSAYFYSSSFTNTSANYSPIINKMSIQPLDLIKFGQFEAPEPYYEVKEVTDIGTGGSHSYKVVVTDSIIVSSTLAANNFAIFRPKLDETSVILEGRKAIGTEEIPQSLLIPYDASTTLKNNIGSIVKSLNTTI
jgi:hypothetical protein